MKVTIPRRTGRIILGAILAAAAWLASQVSPWPIPPTLPETVLDYVYPATPTEDGE